MGLIRYPGGKTKIAPQIVNRIATLTGQLTEFREPFLGGGSIALAVAESIPSITSYRLNDLDASVAALFIAALQRPQELKNLVVEFAPTVHAFKTYQQTIRATCELPQNDEQVVELAFQKIVVNQLSYSGLGAMGAGPLGGINQSKYNIASRWSASQLSEKVNQFYETFSALDTKITSEDYTSLIEDTSVRAMIYLDPPYWQQGHRCYQHCFSPEDHKRLASMLQETPHSWLLSYDDCAEIRDLYSWANIEIVPITYSIVKSRKTQELLISAA